MWRFCDAIEEGFGDEVYIVTSVDYLAVYAANNICKGISEFADKGGSPLGGIIYNVRGMLDDEAVVSDFAEKVGSQVIGHIPNAYLIAEAEIEGKTVIEYAPDSEIANLFRKLAQGIYTNTLTSVPAPLEQKEMREIGQLIRKRTKEKYKHRAGDTNTNI